MKKLVSIISIALLTTNSFAQTVLGQWDFSQTVKEEDGNVTVADVSGKGNSFSGKIENAQVSADGLILNVNELMVGHTQPLPYMDMRSCWEVEAEIGCNTLGHRAGVCVQRRSSQFGLGKTRDVALSARTDDRR